MREIARELGVVPSTAHGYLSRAAAAGIVWPLAANATDDSLMARLCDNGGVRAGARFHPEPDCSALVRELKRPGVNLLVLWEEYRGIHPTGYAYSRFCELFRGLLPARPKRPREKAAVEAGVRFAQSYILGRLRNVTFFSLADCNAAIAAAVERMNSREIAWG